MEQEKESKRLMSKLKKIAITLGLVYGLNVAVNLGMMNYYSNRIEESPQRKQYIERLAPFEKDWRSFKISLDRLVKAEGRLRSSVRDLKGIYGTSSAIDLIEDSISNIDLIKIALLEKQRESERQMGKIIKEYSANPEIKRMNELFHKHASYTGIPLFLESLTNLFY